ncbi:hypothetical protein P0092_18815 [Ruminiclostridium papyrosolvens DSM 2782]|nr:hypothetical protein [Ruminiclostridium papyrosolvens]WES33797.1 hypothetical protein P0092_18810 [Ruminiclostridium papyrosolvens DSM 2782]WES33798.1 hypothetical protein P0092_18815 [Ruminiclostridium papyrosolvens DSM 2782]
MLKHTRYNCATSIVMGTVQVSPGASTTCTGSACSCCSCTCC